MLTSNHLRYGAVAVVTTLAMLASATPPAHAAPTTLAAPSTTLAARPTTLAAPVAAPDGVGSPTPLAFTPITAASDPAVRRAAAALGMPAATPDAPQTRTTASGSRASLQAVVCYVGGSAPHRASPTDNRVVNTTVTVTCTGAVRQITISIWLLWSFDDVSYSTLSNRLNESSRFSPFFVGTTGAGPICLPQYYMGLAHIWVNFLDGTPLEDGGWFGTDGVFLECG